MMDAGFRRLDEFNTSPIGHNEAARDFNLTEKNDYRRCLS